MGEGINGMSEPIYASSPKTLIAFLNDWLHRTRSSTATFGRKALGDPNLVREILEGRQIRPSTEAKLRAFVAAHPDGVGVGNPIRRSYAKIREDAPEPVTRDPCPRCGVRGDIGCSHLPAGNARPEIIGAVWVTRRVDAGGFA